MTKKKERFSIGSYSCYDTTTIKDKRKELSVMDAVDLLNELDKENNSLKQENMELIEILKSINGLFTFDDNYVSWFKDCVIVSKEGLEEIDLGSRFEYE